MNHEFMYLLIVKRNLIKSTEKNNFHFKILISQRVKNNDNIIIHLKIIFLQKHSDSLLLNFTFCIQWTFILLNCKNSKKHISYE